MCQGDISLSRCYMSTLAVLLDPGRKKATACATGIRRNTGHTSEQVRTLGAFIGKAASRCNGGVEHASTGREAKTHRLKGCCLSIILDGAIAGSSIMTEPLNQMVFSTGTQREQTHGSALVKISVASTGR